MIKLPLSLAFVFGSIFSFGLNEALGKKLELRLQESQFPKGRHQVPGPSGPLVKIKEHELKLESQSCLKDYLALKLSEEEAVTFEFWQHHLALSCYQGLRAKKPAGQTFLRVLDRIIASEKAIRQHPLFDRFKTSLMTSVEMAFLAQKPVATQKAINRKMALLKSWFDEPAWESYLVFSGQKPATAIASSAGVPIEEAQLSDAQKKERKATEEIDSTKDFKKQVKLIADFLEDYPSSVRAPEYITLVARVFFGTDANSIRLTKANRSAIIDVLSYADAAATLTRMGVLFYRGRTSDSLALADAVIDRISDSDGKNQVILHAGRQEHYMGESAKGRKRLSRMIAKNGGGSSRHEAAFTLGIIAMRTGDTKEAIESFEIINRETKDTALTGMALNYLYHLYDQSDQKSKREAIRSIVATDFGLTYFGLRIMLSQSPEQRVLPWNEVEPETLSIRWRVTPEQNAAFARFRQLIRYGWYQEAQAELQLMPQPESDKDHVAFAEFEIAANNYRSAIRRFGDLWNKDKSWRTRKRMESIYPKAFWGTVDKYAQAHRMDPYLILALMRQESSFDRVAVSVSDARGLMQMLVPSGQETANLLRVKVGDIRGALFDPYMNIRFGAHYLRRMLRMFGENVPLALSAYNAGPGRIRRWVQMRNFGEDFATRVDPVPQDDWWVDELPWNETRFYSKAILRNWVIYRLLYTNDGLKDVHPVWKTALLQMD